MAQDSASEETTQEEPVMLWQKFETKLVPRPLHEQVGSVGMAGGQAGGLEGRMYEGWTDGQVDGWLGG